MAWLLWVLAQSQPDPSGGGTTPPWLIALGIMAPVAGTVLVAWLTHQAKKARDEADGNNQQTVEKIDAAKILLEGWEERGRQVDELRQAAEELRAEVRRISDQHKECEATLTKQGGIIEAQGAMLEEFREILGMSKPKPKETSSGRKRRGD